MHIKKLIIAEFEILLKRIWAFKPEQTWAWFMKVNNFLEQDWLDGWTSLEWATCTLHQHFDEIRLFFYFEIKSQFMILAKKIVNLWLDLFKIWCGTLHQMSLVN